MKIKTFLASCGLALAIGAGSASAADPAANKPAFAALGNAVQATAMSPAELAATRGMVTAPTPELDLVAVIMPIDIPTTEPFTLGIDTLLDPIFVVMPID